MLLEKCLLDFCDVNPIVRGVKVPVDVDGLDEDGWKGRRVLHERLADGRHLGKESLGKVAWKEIGCFEIGGATKRLTAFKRVNFFQPRNRLALLLDIVAPE